MKRRHFLAQSTLATLALSLPSRAFAATPPPPADKLWVFVDANGAWDPTIFCDPQTDETFVKPDVFTSDQLMTSPTGVSYAPFKDGQPYTVGGQDFFQKYAQKLLVINGVDGETNNHNVGSRNAWSGKLGAGVPTLGGLLAAIHTGTAPNLLPLAFLSTGGYDETLGLVPATRVGKTDPLLKLTQPNLLNENNPDSYFHHAEVIAAIRQKQEERTARLISEQGLPQIKAGLQRLQSARDAEMALSALLGPLKDTTVLPEVSGNESPLLPSARIALAAMAAGICRCMNLSMRGFDSHSNHDDIAPGTAGHRLRLQELFIAIDYVWDRAAALGLSDKMVMVIGSDFGRTRYNNPNFQVGSTGTAPGKDHWPITSTMIMGDDVTAPGVIGQTEIQDGVAGVMAKRVVVNGNQLEMTGDDKSPSNTLIRQTHIHHILRCIAGVKDHDLAIRYPVHRPTDFPLPLLPNVPGWETF
jgi:uncharacterized protein (DUF1501 family)